ncbi:hypothetical protein JWG39_14095, partial [Desulforhopalus vacuolatus]|uniref:hypothetical protein n=1 Tax=Desulforhopalus vacuolatus TaxID=40414 RepID=UPI0019655E12
DESEDKEIASVLVDEDDEEESVAALSLQEDEPAPALSFEEKETPYFSATDKKQVTPALEDAVSAAGTIAGAITTVGGFAESGMVNNFVTDSEDGDKIKENLDSFFDRDKEVPSSDTAVVFMPVEDDEEQDSVQKLRMYSEEYVRGGTRSSFEEMLSERDRLQRMMQGRSLELNLLQLFSAVADVIDRSDEPASVESIALLRSTSQALAGVLVDAHIVRDLEILRVETGKVLGWLSSGKV